jgi:hypothetical protein
VQAFQSSVLATQFGVPVQQLTGVAEISAALQAGVTSWLAIVNPYGECFPITAADQWRAMLGLIRDYVNHGGCWWETGGYSFYTPAFLGAQGWQTQLLGPDGMGYFGLPVGDGPVDQAPEPLTVTALGQELLGSRLSAGLAGKTSTVNRSLPGTADAPSHLTLLAGAQQDFLGAYRLEGWGYLWRVGGFWPNPQVVLPAAVAVMEYVYTHPPLPIDPDPIRYLWHGTLRRASDRMNVPMSLRGAERRSNLNLSRGDGDCFAGLAMTWERSWAGVVPLDALRDRSSPAAGE